MISVLRFAPLALALAGPAEAADLASSLAGRSLVCGSEQVLYIAPDLGTVTVLTSAPGDLAVDERRRKLLPSDWRMGSLDVNVETARRRQRYRLERRPASGRAVRPVALFVDDDTVGDDCAVTRGRTAFVTARFNLIRESLCGNDPLDTCIAVLRQACGREPTSVCVRRVRSSLQARDERAGRS